MSKRLLLLILASGIAACGLAVLLLYHGILQFQYPSRVIYPVRGVDVSAYQGEIDWAALSNEGIQFAFIKATEGSSFVDKRFSYNWEQAHMTNLRVGAYHFFSFDSTGVAQAEHYIGTVPRVDGMLPPVVDLELYGRYRSAPPSKAEAVARLEALLTALEDHYGVRPIIYVTHETYDLYLKDAKGSYDIWIRNVMFYPYLSDRRDWTFWQYSNRGRLDGYKGVETFIDLNVFHGTAEEFAAYGR